MSHFTHLGFGLTCGASGLFVLLSVSAGFAADRCAAYGPGFTAVEGTTACVKIGGHVRVEFGSRSLTYYPDSVHTSASATTAAIRTDDIAHGAADFPEPRHLRVSGDGFDYVDPFR